MQLVALEASVAPFCPVLPTLGPVLGGGGLTLTCCGQGGPRRGVGGPFPVSEEITTGGGQPQSLGLGLTKNPKIIVICVLLVVVACLLFWLAQNNKCPPRWQSHSVCFLACSFYGEQGVIMPTYNKAKNCTALAMYTNIR